MATPQQPASAVSDQYIYGRTIDIAEVYDFVKVLGSGQYGKAHSARHRETGKMYAVKTINKSRFRFADRRYQFDAMRNEIAITRALHHPNIISLFEVYENETDLHLVMELCQGGELFDRIKQKKQYSEAEAQVVLRQIASALVCLHQNKIAHCDLKPDNFLFEGPEDDAKVKIIDFGMARALRRREYLKHLRGTPYYIAPEVLEGEYSEHCDMWSFGVVMFVMLFGFPPFHGNSDQDIFNSIRRGFFPQVQAGWGSWFPQQLAIATEEEEQQQQQAQQQYQAQLQQQQANPGAQHPPLPQHQWKVSRSAQDLIGRLLTKDPLARLAAEEVLEHPWIQGKDVPKHPLPLTVVSNLNNFIKKSRFTNEVLSYLTQSTMSSEEYLALARTFRFIDKNNDGTLSCEEFREALQQTENRPVNIEQLQKIVELADLDGDGTISWKELLLATTARRLAAKEDRLWQSFKTMDLDGDGRLSVDELVQALGYPEDQIRQMIQDVDVDGNGFVDYEEFLSILSATQGEENEIGDVDFGVEGPPSAAPVTPTEQKQ